MKYISAQTHKISFIFYVSVDTSRPPRVLEENGRGYWFIDRETMEEEIREHKFLEYGEHNGHLYGSKLDSIRDVIRQGKMCVLDCSPAVSIPSLNYLYLGCCLYSDFCLCHTE
jgi:guanylate kinase